MKEAPIIVVGAGMAGLACAVELCRRGKAVTVLEAAPAIGGRTRSFIYRGVELDNGQHLMLSCYDQTHKLRDIVQADAGALYRQPFIWSVYSRPNPAVAADGSPDVALAPSQPRGARGARGVTADAPDDLPSAELADTATNGRHTAVSAHSSIPNETAANGLHAPGTAGAQDLGSTEHAAKSATNARSTASANGLDLAEPSKNVCSAAVAVLRNAGLNEPSAHIHPNAKGSLGAGLTEPSENIGSVAKNSHGADLSKPPEHAHPAVAGSLGADLAEPSENVHPADVSSLSADVDDPPEHVHPAVAGSLGADLADACAGVRPVTAGSPGADLAGAATNSRCVYATGLPRSGLVKFSAGNVGGVYEFLGQLSAGAGDSASLVRRLSVFRGMLKLLLWPAPRHASAAEWLRRRGQDRALCQWLWEPLCLAALNTPAHEASAVCLQAILRRVAGTMGALEFVFNRAGLSGALADPCQRFLTENGATVLTGQRVNALLCHDDGAVSGVRTSDGRDWPASAVVLSVPPSPCRRLLDDGGAISQALGQTLEQMDAITLAPIHTLYLQFDEALKGSEAIFGLVGEPIDWVIDRSIVNGQSGLVAVVCSARRIDAPLEAILGLLGEIYGRLPRLLWHKSVVEKHAAFYCSNHIHALRPPARTAVDGLWLNGDWISHSFPSTIETAVSNGFSCAAQMTDDD